jgi:hypothetical protein
VSDRSEVRLVSQGERADKAHSGLRENFSIHPYRNKETGRRQTYNVAGKRHQKSA